MSEDETTASSPAAPEAPGQSPENLCLDTNGEGRVSFCIEVMVTAGPRKSASADETLDPRSLRQLGEDCAGIAVLDANRTCFWLCDGASDKAILHSTSRTRGFSSRMLAQELGAAFVRAVASKTGIPKDGISFGNRTLGDLASRWQERGRNYTNDLQGEGTLKTLLDRMPSTPTGKLLYWQSTMLFGILDHRTGDLYICNHGDCGALILANPIAIVKPNRGHVFLRMKWAQTENFLKPTVDFMTVPRDWYIVRGARAFMALSDGVLEGGNLARDLARLATELGHEPFNNLRARLTARADLTVDDKSVLIGCRRAEGLLD